MTFTGYLSGSRLWALVEAALGVVLPSIWYEIAPKSVLEAMARRKPVVASAIGGLPEQIEDGVTGFLAPPANSPGLAAALQRLASLAPDALAAMGERARHRALTRFSTDAYFDAMVALYQRLGVIDPGQPRAPA